MPPPLSIDYFITVGPSFPLQPIDTTGRDHASASRPSAPRSFIDRVYRGDIQFRYPAMDRSHAPLALGIHMFAVPDEIQLSTSQTMPKLYCFVATGADGGRVYGACLKLWEEIPANMVAELVEADKREMLRFEHEASERRDKLREISVSRSREQEAEEEEEERIERENARRLVQIHNRIEEEKDQWRKHSLSMKNLARPNHNRAISSSVNVSVTGVNGSLVTDSPSRSESAPSEASLTTPNYARNSLSPNKSPSLSPSQPSPLLHQSSIALRQRKVYAPKCLCVLSSHPFLAQAREFLSELYRISLAPSSLPLEHYIANFINEIPLPPLGQVKVVYQINGKSLNFVRPPPNAPLSVRHFPSRLLFELLDIENIILLVESILCERRILLLSTKLSALTIVGETLLSLIWPLRWQHVYIPLLPKSLIDFLFAPMPFLIGMSHSYVKGELNADLVSDLVLVDLDKNSVTINNQRSNRFLPYRERKKLKRALSALSLYKQQRCDYETRMMESLDDAFQHAPSPDELDQMVEISDREEAEMRAFIESEQSNNDAALIKPIIHNPSAPMTAESFIAAQFLRLFTSLLKDYRAYLIFPSASNPSPDPCFNVKQFVRRQDSSSHTFWLTLLETQAFTNFCNDRIHQSQPNSDSDIRFFDEAIVAKRNRSKLSRSRDTPFIDDASYDINETYIVPAPDATGVTQKEYKYDTFPLLDLKMFPHPRKMPSEITKRVASLVKQVKPVQQRKLSLTSNVDMSLESIVYSVWFTLATSIASDYKLLQLLSTAFKVLYDARLCGVDIEAQCYLRLMKCCGACGIPDKAIEILGLMQESGYGLDAAAYTNLLQVFTMNGDSRGVEALTALKNFPSHEKQRESVIASRSAALQYDARARNGSDTNAGAGTDDRASSNIGSLNIESINEMSVTSSTSRSLSSPSTMSGKDSRNNLASPSNNANSNTNAVSEGGHAREISSVNVNTIKEGNEEDETSLLPSPTNTNTTVTSLVNNSLVDDGNDSDDGDDNAIERPTPDDLTRFQRAFTAAFPTLCIDTSDRCPDCARELSDREIRAGWTKRNTDYTTQCPKCGERFAPQLNLTANLKPPHANTNTSTDASAVTDADSSGLLAQHQRQRQQLSREYEQLQSRSQSPFYEKLPLVLPHLPPRVLFRELLRVLEEHGVGYMTSPSFRSHSPALYFNFAWHFATLELPCQFLLFDRYEDRDALNKWRGQPLVHVMRSTSERQQSKLSRDNKETKRDKSTQSPSSRPPAAASPSPEPDVDLPSSSAMDSKHERNESSLLPMSPISLVMSPDHDSASVVPSTSSV